MHALLERAQDFEDDLVAMRRRLHRQPELSFNETETARTAADAVERLGFRVQRGVGRTGVVAEIGGGDGPRVALRADMDALPIHETNDVDYRSTVDGVMHACGHDAHTAMLVGAARLLAERHEAGQWPGGGVRLLFQPSEEASDDENKSGAVRMIEDGAIEDVDGVFGLHVGAHLPAGRIYAHEGTIMAGSDTFDVTVHGTSAHAARPHEGTDALVLAAHVILACQSAVARRLSPLDNGVLTIGTIHGGTADNVVAERVRLRGTIRYFDEGVRKVLRRELERACAIADTLGGRSELDLRPGYPPVRNDAAMTRLAASAAEQALGDGAVVEFEPMMGAEDFAFYLAEVPGSFFWLGAALDPPRQHHHPRFDIDESVLPRGASALAACALGALIELRGK